RIDVESYAIDAQVDPNAQTLRATAKVRFTPLDDVTSLSFELNNALTLDNVTDEGGRQVPASRTAQDMTVRLSLAEKLTKGTASTLTFVYGGKLTGMEESPVWGIKFAAIHPAFAYLMYPSRWFPVNDYTTDRFTTDLRVTVPSGFKVIASGLESADAAAEGKITVRFQTATPSFPASFAVVQGDPTTIASGGIQTALYFRERKDMAGAYGQEIGRAMEFLSGVFGPLPNRNLTVVETEAGTPNGYAAPGMLFLSPRAIGNEVNSKLLANQISRQWWGGLVSPATRNHMWIENGMARYGELLYTENVSGAGAMEAQVHDTYVEALTVEQPPLMQSARLEDYSPEFWAATAGKGAAVLHMLRSIIGDDNFFRLLKTVPERYAGKSINTADFQKVTEEISGQSLNYFFLQWIESSGAPEFKMEYTMFRTSKGFRVNGKISQDLDTFRMPVMLRIDTEGNPEEKKVDVAGTSTDFAVETFGKPKNVVLDPKGQLLRYDNDMRVAVAIKRGEQFYEVAEYIEALNQYKKALDVNRRSSLAHYRTADAYFVQGNYQAAANEYREALSGDLEPKWTEVWAHISLGKIYDITDQRDRAVNEYKLAQRTKDNTQGALEEAQKYITAKFERPRNTN
ncbi:MAG TPA: M1 family aminopeptidase, partial [Bryobacteraceae bacterium]|nr:M1 family aminopeptidase [Bryobacteraceae bacterium]